MKVNVGSVYIYGQGILDLNELVMQTKFHTDPNAHYGLGVWEGVRCNNGKLFRLADHAKRLINSAKITQTPLPVDWKNPDEEIKKGIIAAAKKHIEKTGEKSFYIRPSIYYEYGEMGPDQISSNKTGYRVVTWSWGQFHKENVMGSGINMIVSQHFKFHSYPFFLKAKTPPNYALSIIEKEDARKKNCLDAIFLTKEGFVAEAIGANIFFVKDGKVLTPSNDMPEIINGITRNSVIQLLKQGGLEVIENLIPENLMYECDEAFLTGTAVRIVPITTITDKNEKKHLIGDGTPGEITRLSHNVYMEAINGDLSEFEDWLTDIN
ncbi:MAG TPA: aminotransferase class IV [Candidatus Nanoarchaeia archaeon]|nr:aminotransferase class IV [Candidatus Nanoarchaeia archaeon]